MARSFPGVKIAAKATNCRLERLRNAPGGQKQATLQHTLVFEDLAQHSDYFGLFFLAHYPGDLVGLARLLGHESLDTTKTYTQPTSGELAQRVEQIPLNAYG